MEICFVSPGYQGNFHLSVINAKQWNQMEPMKHFLLNPFYTLSRISVHFLHIVLNTFPAALSWRIYLTIKSFSGG